jgi:hypothetical protein
LRSVCAASPPSQMGARSRTENWGTGLGMTRGE